MAELSNKGIDRLGKRLRRGTTPDDLQLLQDYREGHWPPLVATVSTLSRLPQQVAWTARLKNINTIIEKLRAEDGMELSRMQDIAGARIITRDGRRCQDEIVAEIQRLFGPESTRVKDRRAIPKHGYRAVHVMAKVGKRWIEIQVRTHRQDRWAQVFERVGDLWGRQIRRGKPPDLPDTLIHNVPRREIVEYLTETADQIAAAEEWEANHPDDIGVDGLLAVADDLLGNIASIFDVDEAESHRAIVESHIANVGPDSVFYVVFERLTGRVLHFSAAAERNAKETRAALEFTYHNNPDVEIVSLMSRSEQDLRQTHARYFENVGQLAKKPAE